jgi:hypothetical protein
MPSQTYIDLYQLMESLPVVSTHEHHLPDPLHQTLNLDRVLENTYLAAYARPHVPIEDKPLYLDPNAPMRRSPKKYAFPGQDARERQEFLNRHRHNSYFTWLEKGLNRIYGFGEKLTPENWDLLSTQISQMHLDPGAHLNILNEFGGYQRAVQDSYWDYGSDLGHPELFSPTLHTDMFITSFHPGVTDHGGNSPFNCYPEAPTRNFDDYLDFVRALFLRWREAGAVTLKSAAAYDRSLDYEEVDRAAAARVFSCPPEEASQSDRKVFGDFMFHWFCQLGLELDTPFQVHTGLARLQGSRPGLLEPVIARYPQLHFVLFHAGYPWYDEVSGLLHNYSNVSVDMVWVPIISTTGAILALHEFIEVAPSSDLIAWGSDTWTSEEAIGALLAWRHVAARVLAEKVDDGYWDMAEAEAMAHKLMYRNAKMIYRI